MVQSGQLKRGDTIMTDQDINWRDDGMPLFKANTLYTVLGFMNDARYPNAVYVSSVRGEKPPAIITFGPGGKASTFVKHVVGEREQLSTEFESLPEYIIKNLLEKHWHNYKEFKRDMFYRYPDIDAKKLDRAMWVLAEKGYIMGSPANNYFVTKRGKELYRLAQ
jgi:hypothetical protein